MTDDRADDDATALHRIDRALARIEAAAATHRQERDALSRRHETLRGRIAGAVEALDALIAERGDG